MSDETVNLPDREKLTVMLRELIRILDLVILENLVPLREDLRPAIKAAWLDFRERHEQSILVQVREAPLESLEIAGLTGTQLEVKRRGFFSAVNRFWERAILRELQNVLGWANIWLRSLTAVVSVNEILVELKEVVEKALENLNEE